MVGVRGEKMEKLMYPNERRNCLRANEQYTATTWLKFGKEHTWFQVSVHLP